MAATVLQALGDLYETVDTPTELPSLYSGVIPEGGAVNFPQGRMVHKGTVPTYQRGRGKNGNTGIKYETTKVTFQLWYAGQVSTDPDQNGFNAADDAAERLMAVLTPLALQVDNSTQTVLRVDKKTVDYDGTRAGQGQFVFRADVDVTAQVDY